jgi:hypothetical protein
MKGERILFGVSVFVLAVIAAFIIFGSVQSAAVAFTNQGDHVGSLNFDQLRTMGTAAGDTADETVKAIRGRRLTAATWALAYAVLFAWVVLGPYRRTEKWAWWILMASLIIPQVISIARLLFIGTTVGTLPSALLLAFGLLGLLAGAPRFFLRKTELL